MTQTAQHINKFRPLALVSTAPDGVLAIAPKAPNTGLPDQALGLLSLTMPISIGVADRSLRICAAAGDKSGNDNLSRHRQVDRAAETTLKLGEVFTFWHLGFPVKGSDQDRVSQGFRCEITLFTKAKGASISKSISLIGGRVVSDGSRCAISRGSVRRLNIKSFSGLADLINKLDSSEALGLGRLRKDIGDEAPLISRKYLATAPAGAVTRTKDNLILEEEQPAPILFDYDQKEMTEANKERVVELGGPEGAIASLIPGYVSIGRIIRRSTSAGIFNTETGEEYGDSGDIHLYSVVRDGADVERTLKTLQKRAWLDGMGWIYVSKAGSLLIRSIIDTSVAAPERLIFEGAPTIHPPLAQRNRLAVATEGAILDTRSAITDLSPEEQKEYERLILEAKHQVLPRAKQIIKNAIEQYVASAVDRGESEERARSHALATYSHRDVRLLFPTQVFLFDELGQVSGAEILSNPSRFDGERLADPLETYDDHGNVMTNRAVCYVDKHTSEIKIHSQLHGGVRYVLRHDRHTLNTLIQNSPKDSVVASFVSAMVMGGAASPVSESNESILVDAVSKKSGAGKRSIHQELKDARQARKDRDKANDNTDATFPSLTNDDLVDADLVWPDVDREGEPKPTLRNVEAAFNHLGIVFWFDELADKPVCDVSALIRNPRFTEALTEITDQNLLDRLAKGPVLLTDSVVRVLHRAIRVILGPYLGRDNISELAKTFADFTIRKPFLEEISQYRWDGVTRLDTWLPVYLGASDTPLNRQIGAKTLIAAVRRNLEPGCKYDQLLILEGPQGIGKSTALKLLGGDYYVSGKVLTLENAQKRVEGTRGKVIFEEEEMSGHNKADQDQIKSNLSRTNDQVRMAYGEYESEHPLRCVFIGTTNRMGDYLADETGARRFWPVMCYQVLLPELTRDRNQLWAEAYKRAMDGESIMLPQELWPVAAEEATKRKSINPWADVIQARQEIHWQVHVEMSEVTKDRFELRVSSFDILTVGCELRTDQHQKNSKRVADAMRELGWNGPKLMKIDGEAKRGYTKEVDAKTTSRFRLGSETQTLTWREYYDRHPDKSVPF